MRTRGRPVGVERPIRRPRRKTDPPRAATLGRPAATCQRRQPDRDDAAAPRPARRVPGAGSPPQGRNALSEIDPRQIAADVAATVLSRETQETMLRHAVNATKEVSVTC